MEPGLFGISLLLPQRSAGSPLISEGKVTQSALSCRMG